MTELPDVGERRSWGAGEVFLKRMMGPATRRRGRPASRAEEPGGGARRVPGSKHLGAGGDHTQGLVGVSKECQLRWDRNKKTMQGLRYRVTCSASARLPCRKRAACDRRRQEAPPQGRGSAGERAEHVLIGEAFPFLPLLSLQELRGEVAMEGWGEEGSLGSEAGGEEQCPAARVPARGVRRTRGSAVLGMLLSGIEE